ncbi:MAG: transporter substrate-binding domain-containing protein [Clostridia bacterium]|nr:transporter substrate-binding domain-containing protein [Clostridia bacterium]
MKKILAMILAAMMLLTVVGCGGGASENDGKPELVMATNANFPPYEFMEGDQYKGIDIEMAQKLAEKLGMELVIENVEFGTIVGGVETKKFDIGVAGMTVTEERKQQVNFSDSYATGVQVVIVKEGGKVATLDDLAGADIMIGVQQDTTGHIYAGDSVENGGYGEDHVTAFPNGADAVTALINGQVDAVIIDKEPAKSFVAANEGKGLSILDAEWAVEDYAIAINKENTDLLAKINAALAEMKADGTLQAIIDSYIKAE